MNCRDCVVVKDSSQCRQRKAATQDCFLWAVRKTKQSSDTEQVDIKPCPFCGNEDVREIFRPHFDISTIAVECGMCRTRGPEYRIDNMEEPYSRIHVSWWNTRKTLHKPR